MSGRDGERKRRTYDGLGKDLQKTEFSGYHGLDGGQGTDGDGKLMAEN